MYITITPQKLTKTFSQSAGELVAYLEKENREKSRDQQEFFFNQYNDGIDSITVTGEIDGNAAKPST